jgi:hypothetical protein
VAYILRSFKRKLSVVQQIIVIGTGYGLDDRWVGVRILVVKNFRFSKSFRREEGASLLPLNVDSYDFFAAYVGC